MNLVCHHRTFLVNRVAGSGFQKWSHSTRVIRTMLAHLKAHCKPGVTFQLHEDLLSQLYQSTNDKHINGRYPRLRKMHTA